MKTIKNILLLNFAIFLLAGNLSLFSQDNCMYACDDGCPNADFSYGNWTNWTGYTGTFHDCCPTEGFVGTRHTLNATDGWAPSMMWDIRRWPDGCSNSARLGNTMNGAEAERLIYTYTVTGEKPAFVYQFAVVMEEPGHPSNQQPKFTIRVRDENGNTVVPIECGAYTVIASSSLPGWQSKPGIGDSEVIFKDWTNDVIDLTNYIGQTVTVEFTTYDCEPGAHYAYALIRAYCVPMEVSATLCAGNDTAYLEAPGGFTSYEWSTGEVTQGINIVNPVVGTVYHVTLTSQNGCEVVYSATIDVTDVDADFSFTSDECSGDFSFTDLSTTNGEEIQSWYWNFEDGNMSEEQNPSNTYSLSEFRTVVLKYGYSWTVPDDVTEITAECWGAGGSGGYLHDKGGGGGGAYATQTFNVIPGTEIFYSIGQGGYGYGNLNKDGNDTWFMSTDANGVTARGGKGAISNNGGAGGNAANCIPVAGAFSGGNGGNSQGWANYGGGGGGGAGSTENGSDGGDAVLGEQEGLGGAGGEEYGGNGGNAAAGTTVPGEDGNNYGGGGGGPGNDQSGGNGAQGVIRITYETPNTEIYNVSLTVTTDNGCISTITKPISVSAIPPVDELPDVTECDSYILPDLTNGEYYTAPNGGGTQLFAGHEITTTQTIYIYAESETEPICTNESSFIVTIYETPIIEIISIECDPSNTTYTVQFTNTVGDISTTAGTIDGNSIINIPVGTDITITSDNNGCIDEVPVISPICECPEVQEPTNPQNQAICEGDFTPALSVDNPEAGYQINWYDESVGGTQLASNTNSYIPDNTEAGVYTYYAEVEEIATGCKSTRIPVTLTIHPIPDVDELPDVTECDSYTLPALANGEYYTAPNGGGTQLSAGTEITTTQTTYIYAESGTTPNCTNESSFIVTIYETPVIDIISIECDASMTTYTVEFSNTIGDVSTTAGTIVGNSIIDIPVDTDITITSDNNGCIATIDVVSPNCACDFIPPPENPQNQAICEGDVTPALTVNPTGAGYQINWYDASVGGTQLASNTNSYIPDDTEAGIYTYYAEVEEIATGCKSDRIPVTLTIHPIPDVDELDDVTECDSYTLPALANGEYYTAPNGGGTQLSAGTEITTTQTTYIYAESGTTPNCTNESSFNVTIYETPVIEIISIECDPSNTTYTVEFTNTVGDISTTAGTIDGNSIIDIPVDTDITITSDNNGCIATADVVFPICDCDFIPPPENPQNQEICEGDVTPALSVDAPGAGYQINWYDAYVGGILLASNTNSYIPDDTETDVYIYYAEVEEIATGCKSPRIPVTLIIHPIPVVDITPAGPYCIDDPEVTLSATPLGGTWSGNGITNTGTGTFNPTVAGEGEHIIAYEVTVNGCTNLAQITILVFGIVEASVDPAGPFCEDEPEVTLIATPEGGTWSGNGVNAVTGVFNPATAGPGTHTITYNVGTGNCADSYQITIVVNPVPVVNITPAGPYCKDDPEVTLSATPPGGTWSGNGITNQSSGIFDPTVAGEGEHIITYEVTVNGCTDSAQRTILVFGIVEAIIDPIGPFCHGEFIVDLTATPEGGNWAGYGVQNYGIFNVGNAGPGIHKVIYTIPDPCGDSDTILVTVYPSNIDATMVIVSPSCYGFNDAHIDISVTGGTPPYTFVLEDREFTDVEYISGLTAGQYEITIIDSNGCTGVVSATIAPGTEDCIKIPNAFSPNGDGVNDEWIIENIEYYIYYHVKVFNRWGQEVYSGQHGDAPWDGTYKGSGRPLPTAPYLYIINLHERGTKDDRFVGIVTLIY